jgi:hypothetical protein
MPLHLVSPFDQAQESPGDDGFDPPPPDKSWRGHLADTCYILVKAGGFLASTYLMTLGLPLLFFLMISGGDVELFFAQIANFADRFLGADSERQVGFVNDLKFGLIGLATLVACLRMPRFLCEVAEGLREEKL